MPFADLLAGRYKFWARGPKLAPQDVASLERMINAPLPGEYRDYLLHANGGIFVNEAVEDDGYFVTVHWPKGNGIFPDEDDVLFGHFFWIDDSLTIADVEYSETISYNYEIRKDFLPENTLPIAGDPGGGLFLIDFGKEKSGEVTYWRALHVNQLSLAENDHTLARAFQGQVADSFSNFVLSMRPNI